MGKLPRKQRPKRSHFKTEFDYERALWAYACSKSNINVWMRHATTRPSPRKRRLQRREDERVYAMLTHPGFGRVAA